MTHRAAIIGAGAPAASTNENLEGFSIGYSHARGYLAHPDVEIIAIADLSEPNAKALAGFVGGATTFTDYRRMLAEVDIDVLSICTWPALHHEMTVAAVDAGVKAVLCEKPMGVSLAETDDMISAAVGAGSRLFVNHQRRYEQPYAGAQRLIASGAIGELLRFEGFVGDRWDLMSWGSHWVDMALYFADSDVEWVLSAAPSSGKLRYGHRVEDQMLMQFGFSSGALGLVHTGAHTTGAGLIVTATGGSMLLHERGATLMTPDGDSESLAREYLGCPPDAPSGFELAIADMLCALHDGTASRIDGASGHATTEVMMAAYASAADGQVIRIPMTDRATDLRP